MSKSDNETMSRSERKNQKNKKPKNTNKMALWKKIVLGFVGLILVVGIGGLGLFTYYASNAPELTNDDLMGAYSSDLLDINGNVFYTLGAEEREFAAADEYPQVLKDAMMAIEDQRFESHLGIDPIGIARAAVGYVTNAGEIVGGGSTITQQLVKNAVFSSLEEDQTLERKAQEAWLAIQLERELSKEQIMTLYLNRIHMGGNVYGVATAAEEFLGKHVSELELHEAAMFAAMPKAPNYYNPYVDAEASEERRNLVLDQMVNTGSITQEEADAAKSISVTQGLQEPTEDPNALVFDAYLDAVVKEVENKLDSEIDIGSAGLTIYTNFDPNAQQILFDVVNTEEYVNFANDEIQTAVTLVDSETGKVSALIGGRNIETQRSNNRAIDMQRDVGSTIKPLTTFGPAIEFLQYSTYEQIDDRSIANTDWAIEAGWDFLNNWDNQFKGQISMREALVDSRNIPAAKFFNEDEHLGGRHDDISEWLENLGIDLENISQDGALVPYNAISGTMSPLDLAGAYTAFANQGNFTEPYTVNKVVTQDGQEIDLTPKTNKVMEDFTAYMITDMLKEVVPYYSNQLTVPGYVHAAKTGTTNYDDKQMVELNVPQGGVPDNWVVGYSPYYTMSVWVGYDEAYKEGNALVSSDGSIHLPRLIYQAAMTRLSENLERRDWQRPDSVVELKIKDGSNPALLARPGDKDAVSELFIRGSQPTEVAEPDYVLTAPANLRARYNSDDDEVEINWDAFELPDDVDEDVEYVININGQETTQAENELVITDPPRETLRITVAVRVDDETGPTANVQIVVPEPQEDEDEEEEEEEPDTPEEPETPNPDEPDDGEEEEEPEPDNPDDEEEDPGNDNPGNGEGGNSNSGGNAP